MLRTHTTRRALSAGLAAACLAVCLALPVHTPRLARADGGSPPTLQAAFTSAAQEFGVPQAVLLGVAYNESRWEQHGGDPSAAGGYGIMHLTDIAGLAPSAKGGEADRTPVDRTGDPSLHTLATAAALLGRTPATLQQDPLQNIRGGAALLAQYARDTVGSVPADPAAWYGAVAKYSGSHETAVALDFADQVYRTIQQGAARTTSDGQTVGLAASSVTPDTATAQPLHLHPTDGGNPECPVQVACNFVPAYYGQNTASDPTDYGNYDIAFRGMTAPAVRYIVIHDTEENYNTTLRWFQNPNAYVTANYVVRSADGLVTQMVPTHDIAWQAGDWYVNMHSIGIEHEGYALQGATWYTESMYRSSAALVRYLCQRYNIPMDRAHIFGHDEIPSLSTYRLRGQHWDPGPYWDWAHFMELLGAPISPTRVPLQPNTLVIKPTFSTNQPPVAGQPAQPANFVELHTAPSADSPLLADPILGTPSRAAYYWGDKAVTGQQFVPAGHQGDWDAIYYGGQVAWFHNPGHQNTLPGYAQLVRPHVGRGSIPVYGAAWPEDSAMPARIGTLPLRELYRIPAGQTYVVLDRITSDYYDAQVYTLDGGTSTEVPGTQVFYRIQFNHRFVFVKAGDVDLVAGP